MVCDEIERPDVSCRHVAAYVLQQPSCDATVAALFLCCSLCAATAQEKTTTAAAAGISCHDGGIR